MASYTIRDLDAATIAAARERARASGVALADVLRAYLAAYADGQTAQQRGGEARWAGVSETDRSTQMQAAARARWDRR